MSDWAESAERFKSDTAEHTLTVMLEFFRGGARYGINPQYWAEKVVDGRERTKRYSEERFRRLVTEHFVEAVQGGDAPRGLGRALRAELLDDDEGFIAYEDAAREALNAFEYKGFRFSDTWEWDFRDYDWTYLWCCHAIQWGTQRYDAAKAAELAAVTL